VGWFMLVQPASRAIKAPAMAVRRVDVMKGARNAGVVMVQSPVEKRLA
jgi:hypothetical protein